MQVELRVAGEDGLLQAGQLGAGIGAQFLPQVTRVCLRLRSSRRGSVRTGPGALAARRFANPSPGYPR